MTTYGDRLRRLRKNKGIHSQKEFGKLFGLSESTISMYERSERRPDYETLQKFSEFFEVSIDYIITGNELDNSSNEMWKEILDPKTQIFFKDLKDAPEEKIEELIRFWEFIKNRDK
ncbi:helix-turn-helix transcriptional regulator [Metabacillus sp. FJAT-53654]|uniref:Helix-turn-helix transcriptional regulator n=1 Tax=Metabacillus rhizosphaerae TaxID=3117747 RepID=A0ABZ2MY70_9BACI